MAVVSINPTNSGTLKLGLTAAPTLDYACQVTEWTLIPVTNQTERPGTFCSAPTQIPGASSWTVSFNYLQDWGQATNSISKLFFENDGKILFFEFDPTQATPFAVPKALGSFYAMAGSYGGPAGDTWVFSGTCSMTGPPTFSPVLPVILDADGNPIDTDDDEELVTATAKKK